MRHQPASACRSKRSCSPRYVRIRPSLLTSMYPGEADVGRLPSRLTTRTPVMPGNGMPTQRPSASGERCLPYERAAVGPTSLCP